eukprot:scaffold382892_cov73-Cyclotella_meneghiniana.AAC.2
MVRYTVAASVLLMAATATSSEIAIDGRGIFSTNCDAAMDGGRKLFSKIPDFVSSATARFLQAMGVSSAHPVCIDKGFNATIDPATLAIMEEQMLVDKCTWMVRI